MEALQDKRSPGERFEQFVTDVIYDRAKMSPAARALAAFLRALWLAVISTQSFAHSSQMFTPSGPRIRMPTSLRERPQKAHLGSSFAMV